MEERSDSLPLFHRENREAFRNEVAGQLNQRFWRTGGQGPIWLHVWYALMKVLYNQMLVLIFIFLLTNTEVSEPIDIFVVVDLMVSGTALLCNATNILQIYYRFPQFVLRPIKWLERVNPAEFLFRFFLAWQITGNIWFYSCNDCLEDAPALTYYTLAIIIIGYLQLCLPVVLLCCVFTCIPILIIVFLVIDPTPSERVTSEMLEELKTAEYNQEEEEGETECVVCTESFVEGDLIVILPCDSRHFFHESCGKNWLRVKVVCPLCRKTIFN